jgi:hypothetical protein
MASFHRAMLPDTAQWHRFMTDVKQPAARRAN